MTRIFRIVALAALGGLLGVAAIVTCAVIIVKMGQTVVAQVAPNAAVPPAKAFYDYPTVKRLAPWAFLLGVLSVLVPSGSRRRRGPKGSGRRRR